jgi:lipid-A-disaccharide synthase
VRVFLIAGEPSGDQARARADGGAQGVAARRGFDGIGGEAMEAEGMHSRFPMSDLSVMGIAEVLGRYGLLRQRLAEATRAVVETRPDVLLTIDSPDFGLRVAKAIKAAGQGTRCVHYVAPTIWAWRAGRAKKLRGVADHLLALFPFEPPLWEAQGIPCDFVGHPVVAEPVATEDDARAFRGAFGIGDAPMVLALPGSRRSEVERLAGRFGEALGTGCGRAARHAVRAPRRGAGGRPCRRGHRVLARSSP